MEQDVNDNENPILANSDCDHKEGLEYLVYFQKIDLMILQDRVRDNNPAFRLIYIWHWFLISLYEKHRAGLD